MSLSAQTTRWDAYQLENAPDNANILIGPFSSDLAFSQSVGIRNIRSSGAGMDYLYASHGKGSASSSSQPNTYGRVKKDGTDFPMVSQLTANNYLLISKYMGVNISFSLAYHYFPNGTEDDSFDMDPSITAQMGSFTAGASADWSGGTFNGRDMGAYSGSQSRGFFANFSTDFELTPYVRGRFFERPSYRVDYVDSRGYADTLSGQRYPVFQNQLGVDFDWQMAPDKALGYSVSRTDTIPQGNGYDISRSVIYHHGLEYREELNPLTAVGCRADYNWRDYLNQRGSQFQQDYVVFLDRALSDDTTVNASLGYSIDQMRNAGGTGATAGAGYETNGVSGAVIGGVGVQTRLTDFLSHSLGYSRSQRAGFQAGAELADSIRYHIQWANPETWSIGFSTAYEVVTPQLARAGGYSDWANQLSVARSLTHSLSATITTAYVARMNDAPPPDAVAGGDLFLSSDYDTWATTVGLVKTLTDRLKLYTYAEHLERLSSNAELAGTRDTVGMTIGYYYDF